MFNKEAAYRQHARIISTTVNGMYIACIKISNIDKGCEHEVR